MVALLLPAALRLLCSVLVWFSALVWFLNMVVMLGGVGECMLCAPCCAAPAVLGPGVVLGGVGEWISCRVLLHRACCTRLQCGSCAWCVGGCYAAVPAPYHPHGWCLGHSCSGKCKELTEEPGKGSH